MAGPTHLMFARCRSPAKATDPFVGGYATPDGDPGRNCKLRGCGPQRGACGRNARFSCASEGAQDNILKQLQLGRNPVIWKGRAGKVARHGRRYGAPGLVRPAQVIAIDRNALERFPVGTVRRTKRSASLACGGGGTARCAFGNPHPRAGVGQRSTRSPPRFLPTGSVAPHGQCHPGPLQPYSEGAGAPPLLNPVSMLTRFWRELFADPNGSPALIRRLLVEHAAIHRRRYLLSFACMAVGAGCTAAAAFIVGRGFDQAYMERRFEGVAIVGIALIALFAIKGFATYGQAVTLARVGNQIIAENQRRMFNKLLGQDASFYADRHSSEFAARITFGASSAAQVLSLVINALGRDLLSLIGLVGVMVWKAPFMAVLAFMLMPPAVLTVRKLIKRVRAITLTQFGGGADILKTMQETIQGFKIIKAFNLETVVRAQVFDSIAAVERASNKLARFSNRSTPLMETLGGFAIGAVL